MSATRYLIARKVRAMCVKNGKRIADSFLAELDEFVAGKIRHACTRSKRDLTGDDLFPVRSAGAATNAECVTDPPCGRVVSIRRSGSNWLAECGELSAAAPSKPISQIGLRLGHYDLGILDARKALCDQHPYLWSVPFQLSV